MKANKSNPFEGLFHMFVADFGGRILKEGVGATADYYFAEYDVIVELKTLTVDSTAKMDTKFAGIVEEYAHAHGGFSPGQLFDGPVIIEMPADVREKWLRPLRVDIEHLIGDANRQIRNTKKRLGLTSAKGMIVISNVANHYFNHPDFFRRLMAEILRKRTHDGELRYGDINGGIYSSFVDVKSEDRGMCFWANLQMEQTPGEDVSRLMQLQGALRSGWYQFLRKNGVPIQSHGVQDDPPREVFVPYIPSANRRARES